MPVPKQRHTKSKTGRRRSHHALKKRGISVCPKCGQPILPHTACLACGFYKGREVINTMKKLTKKEKKAKEKEMAKYEKEHGGEGKAEKPLDMADLSKKI